MDVQADAAATTTAKASRTILYETRDEGEATSVTGPAGEPANSKPRSVHSASKQRKSRAAEELETRDKHMHAFGKGEMEPPRDLPVAERDLARRLS